MASRVITAAVTSGSNIDKQGGQYVTFGNILSDTGAVAGASIISATLTLGYYKSYTTGYYLNVIYGGNSGSIVGRTGQMDNNADAHTGTHTLQNIAAEMLTSSVSTITIGIVATSGIDNKINVRSGSTAVLTIEYVTNCTAPTSIAVSSTNIAPGASTTLSWSGAQAGSGNPITSYKIYRAFDYDGEYTFLKNASGTSTSVTAPTTSGDSYCYKVMTAGAVAGYNSGLSSVYACVACYCTDCTAPTSITLARDVMHVGASTTLSWGGALPGTNNAIAGYAVYRSTTENGSYTLLTTVTGTSASVAASGTEGDQYYYKVQSVGTYTAYNSGLSSCVACLTASAAPVAPSFVCPASGASTKSRTPSVVITVHQEPNDFTQVLYLSIDGGAYRQIWSGGAPETVVRCLASTINLAGGEHTFTAYVKNSADDTSPTKSVSITVDAVGWVRELDSGELISGTTIADTVSGETLMAHVGNVNDDILIVPEDSMTITNDTAEANSVTISHQAEIAQLYACVNTIRAYYGLQAIDVPASVGNSYTGAGAGKIGMFAAWAAQMVSLQAALADVYTISGKPAPAWETVNAYPKASVITQIHREIRKA